MEIIDIKLQEAIVSIQSHANRIKNIIKNDPINNKADASWKITFKAKDMLQKEKNENVKNDNLSMKNTSVKTIPLQKDHKPKLPLNRTIQIPNVGRLGPELWTLSAEQRGICSSISNKQFQGFFRVSDRD